MKIYLAGKMSGLTIEEMNKWRLKATKLLEQHNIKAINPVDYYNFELDSNTYNELEVKNFDLHLVRNCDLVLINLNHQGSIGTAIELHESYENYKIPVVAFATKENYAKAHPWVQCSINRCEETMEDAIDYVLSFYKEVIG